MLNFIEKLWYGKYRVFSYLLLPCAWFYCLISQIRRCYLVRCVQSAPPVPIIVVGNISVGGVGKTPLVVAIVQHLQQKGLKVGIVSRGYGATVKHMPYEVRIGDPAALVGDEPLLLAQKTRCPVIIATKRVEAVQYLMTQHQCQIIISDDGLQHYTMGRTIEIAVIDGTRGLGNKFCLPVGPLREAPSRLKQVDFVVVNGEDLFNIGQDLDPVYCMKLVPEGLIRLNTLEPVSYDVVRDGVRAVAGIGNPQRFYSTLRELGIKFTSRSYPDHYYFQPNDFNDDALTVVMTEKDAVKCRSFSTEHMYFLAVQAILDDAFWNALDAHQQLQGYY